MVEGEDLVEAALAAGLEPVELLVAGDSVAEDVLAAVSTLPHPARTIAVFRRAELPALDAPEPARAGLALWRVADPGNVGTLVRSADAFGAFLALSRGCADPTGPKALRASAGAVFRVPLGSFEEAPGRRIGLVAHGGRPLPEVELGKEVTFVLGAERKGLPAEVAADCEELATIPLAPGAESLNVAVAGAIALYELHRRSAAQTRPAVTLRLAEVVYYVRDMRAAIAFYRDVLGLELEFESSEWTTFHAGGCKFALHAAERREPGIAEPDAAFLVEDIDVERERLQAAGVELTAVREPLPGLRVCDGRDPDGNRFSLEDRRA